MLVIEPARPDRHVALGVHPVGAWPIAAIQSLDIGVPRREVRTVLCRPAGLARDAALIADPPDVGTGVAEQHRTGLEIAHELPGIRPVVVGAVVDLAPPFAAPTIWSASKAVGLKSAGDSSPSPHSRFVNVLMVKWRKP